MQVTQVSNLYGIPTEMICVHVPFRCPLFKVLNYPVTFCWKLELRSVTSVERTCLSFTPKEWTLHPIWAFCRSWLGLFTPCLLLVRHSIPHHSLAGTHIRNQDTSMVSALDTEGPWELGRDQWGREYFLETAVPRWIFANPSHRSRGIAPAVEHSLWS